MKPLINCLPSTTTAAWVGYKTQVFKMSSWWLSFAYCSGLELADCLPDWFVQVR